MLKILIMEDEDTVRESLKELLQIRGYEVIDACNGAEGVQFALIHLPDLIISDIMMPELNGYEALKRIRANELTRTIPFIFLSAKAEYEDQRIGMEIGADDYLTKPFSQKDLYNAIETRLRKHQEIVEVANKEMQELKINLAATLPHEFRTPLNGILATSQFLMQEANSLSTEEFLELQTSIYTSALRLKRLVTNYLLFSELELMRVEGFRKFKKMNSTTSNPLEIIEKHISTNVAKYNRREDVSVSVENKELAISVSYFDKLCEEIIENCFKFSKAGEEIKIYSETINNYFFLRFKDYAGLLSYEDSKRLTSYMQFNRQIWEQQGIGLGLAIVNRIVEFAEGELTIETKEGISTTFCVKLKLANQSG